MVDNNWSKEKKRQMYMYKLKQNFYQLEFKYFTVVDPSLILNLNITISLAIKVSCYNHLKVKIQFSSLHLKIVKLKINKKK